MAHFGRGLEVVAGAGEGEARTALVVGRLVEGGTGVDGQQRLVGLGVVFVGVVQVVGGNQRDVQFLGQAQQVLGDPAFDVQAVVHELAEVVFLAEDVLELGGRGLGLGVLAQAELGLHLAGGAAGGGDEALVVGVQQVAVQARVLAEDRIQGGDGGGLEQVLHARCCCS